MAAHRYWRLSFRSDIAFVFEDTFATDTSASYTQYADTAGTWAVSGGELVATNGAQALFIRNGTSYTDVVIEADINYAYNGGLVLRFIDSNNYYLATLSDDSGGSPTQNLQLFKRVAGTFTQIGSNVNLTWARGTSKKVRFQIFGTTLSVYFDDTLVLSGTDSAITGPGGVGMRNSDTGQSKYQAFRYEKTKIGVGELQMRTSIGGSNILTGGTISASDSISPYTAAKAVDGLTTDTGSGNGWLGYYPGWLAYDFGAGNEKAIQELVIYAPGTGGLTADQLPTNWDLEWSDDNINWLKQRSYDFDISTSAWGLSESRVYDVRKPVSDHSQLLFSRIASHVYTAPGEPTVPIYDPGAESGKIRALDRIKFAADLNHGGQYKLAGTTTVLGDPAPRRVRLYHQFDGRLYAEMYTAVDGAFEFRNIELGPWTVVGIDDTGTYNGVIYTHVNAVPM